MNTSFYNGISGVNTQQYGLDVLADNIANISTNGFKKSNTPEFSTMFSQTLSDAFFSPTSSDIGLGVKMTAPTLNMDQGVFQTTDNVFDLALGGDGWFGVQSSNNKSYYTRAGTFDIDKNGNMVDKNGNYLLGTSGGNISPTTLSQNILENIGKYYNNNSSTLGIPNAITDIPDIPLGSISSQTKITLPNILYYPPDATTNVSYKANLNPQILTDSNGTEIPNVEHFSSSIISPTGDKDILGMTYTKRVPQPSTGSTWDGKLQILSFYENYDSTKTYDPALYSVDKTAEKVYKIIDSKNSIVSFASTGELLSANMPTMSNSGTPMTVDVGTPNSFTGFVSSTNLGESRSEQHNGYLSGLLKDYGMDGNGNIIAEFDNGRSVPVAKIAVYHFRNNAGLQRDGSTLFNESPNSGKPTFYTDSSGNSILGAQIKSGVLEGSNVSMARALTELIMIQKGFDASAKSITTSDQMIQNAINMKK